MIFDSSVVIDLTRGDPGATAFVTALALPPSISVITVTEVLRGVRCDDERRMIDGMFSAWTLLDVTLPVAEEAAAYQRRYQHSHGLDISDALIAATASVHDLPLATLNLKHFPMFEGLSRPY